MSETIAVTFQGGAFVPDQPVQVATGTRAKVVLDEATTEEVRGKAFEGHVKPSPETMQKFNELCDRLSFNSAGLKLTRDELHERR